MAKAHGIWPAELKSKLTSLNIYEIYDRRHIQRYIQAVSSYFVGDSTV
jgi:hypothetical protein